MEPHDLPNELSPRLIDRLRARKAPGIGPARGSEQVTTARTPIGGQHEMRTADQPVIFQDAARVMTRGGFTGPRGRYDPEYPGVKEYQAAGVPPVLAPYEPIKLLPKDTALPPVPHQMTRVVDFAVTIATGRLLDRDAGHPWHTIQLDNYSKQWLYVPAAARYVMPYCVGVQFPIYSAASKIEIDALSHLPGSPNQLSPHRNRCFR